MGSRFPSLSEACGLAPGRFPSARTPIFIGDHSLRSAECDLETFFSQEGLITYFVAEGLCGNRAARFMHEAQVHGRGVFRPSRTVRASFYPRVSARTHDFCSDLVGPRRTSPS